MTRRLKDSIMTAVTNEVLAAKLDTLAENQRNLELKVEALPNQIDHSYIRSDIFELRMKELDNQMLGIRSNILTLENRKTLMNWVTPTLSAIFGSVLTFLIIQQLSLHK